MAARAKLDWKHITEVGAGIVETYDTSVTLRQLFYRLVSIQVIPNTLNAYKGLSRHTAIARRDGWFPDLIDPGREITRYRTFRDPYDAMNWLRRVYRRNRTEHQDYNLYVAVEKLGIREQLQAWFADMGVGIIVLRGYSSQSYVKEIQEDVEEDGRPAVFIYAGDFDPSGEDIERDFLERTDCWDHTRRIALTPRQVIDYNLPPLPGKTTDSRSAAFAAKHGQLVQVELDALDPDDLRRLYQDEIDQWWDEDGFERSYNAEQRERRRLNVGDVALDLGVATDLAEFLIETADKTRDRRVVRYLETVDAAKERLADPDEEEDDDE